MTANEILKIHFKRKQEQNSAYSLRALARDLGVSPSFVSSLFQGKKKISKKIFFKLTASLEMDEYAVASLQQALNKEASPFASTLGIATESSTVKFKPIGKKRAMTLLHKWYYIAVLDLITCKNAKSEISWISRKLGLLSSEVEEALEVLSKLELIKKHNEKWVKVVTKLRIPTVHSQSEIRDFHRQMIEKALMELKFKHQQADFDRRLINGITLAINPQKIKKARQRINEALHEIAEELMDDDSTELYQINLQLFPLSK